MKALIVIAAFATAATAFPLQTPPDASTPAALTSTHPIPRLVQQDGRYALMVDGAPYLMLGAQSNNSSD